MCIAAYDDENDVDDIHRLSVKYKIARATIQRSVTSFLNLLTLITIRLTLSSTFMK